MSVDLNEYVLPLYSARGRGDNPCTVVNYAGTSFFINSTGFIATCAHNVQKIPNDSYLVAKYKNTLYRLSNIKCHEHFDIAVAKLGVCGNRHLTDFRGTVTLGLEVSAFGFVSAGKDETDQHRVDERLFLGYVGRITENQSFRPTGSEMYEVSFPSISFSGAPLCINTQMVGILFGNMESSITVHESEEIQTGNSSYRETIKRVVEFGLSHTLETIYEAFNDLDTQAFT